MNAGSSGRSNGPSSSSNALLVAPSRESTGISDSGSAPSSSVATRYSTPPSRVRSVPCTCAPAGEASSSGAASAAVMSAYCVLCCGAIWSAMRIGEI